LKQAKRLTLAHRTDLDPWAGEWDPCGVGRSGINPRFWTSGPWTKDSTEASSPPGKTCAPHTLLAISSFSQRKPLHPAASSSLDPPGFPGHTEMRIQPTCYFEVFNSWERAQKSSLTCFLRPMGRITKMGLEEAAQSLHSACTSPLSAFNHRYTVEAILLKGG
jgi:hypothetical protein